MNFLFAALVNIAGALVATLAAWAIAKLIERHTGSKFPNLHSVAASTFAVLAIIGVFTAAGTYGPRVELSSTKIPAAPSSVEVNKAAPLVEEIDRRGMGDRLIDESERP